jgi:hypothetical protein
LTEKPKEEQEEKNKKKPPKYLVVSFFITIFVKQLKQNNMLFELRDYVSGDTCGIVRVTNFVEGVAEMDNDMNIIDPKEEIEESWTEFNQVEEHELDSYNVDDFVEWHNEGRVTQIERVFVEIIQPY